MSFMSALKEDVTELPIVSAPPIQQDNVALGFIRKAVNAPSFEEMDQFIDDKLAAFNRYRMVELKTPDFQKKLDTEHRHYLFEDILTVVHANIPVALVGPAGSGKSTVMEQVAKALEKKFYLQNAVTGTHELTGYKDAYGAYHTTTFRTAFEEGGVLFVDEVDTSDAGALKWMNTALANGVAMFPDSPDPVKRHEDFRVAIAANTYGTGADRLYVGANQLDASTLDRFVFIDFGYDQAMEKLLTSNQSWCQRVQNLRVAAQEEKARIVISPRATIHGAKLLDAGWDREKVEQRVVWKGFDPELRERILAKAKGSEPKLNLLEQEKLNRKQRKQR